MPLHLKKIFISIFAPDSRAVWFVVVISQVICWHTGVLFISALPELAVLYFYIKLQV